MNASKKETKMLMLCMGNNGRADDALGWMFGEALAPYDNRLTIEYRYQLQIEDALLVSQYKKVIFVDASRVQYENGFSLFNCIPSCTHQFTTHTLTPETVLWLARDLFNQTPDAYVLAISGIHWELHQGITIAAQKNFQNATSFFKEWLSKISSIVSV